MLQAHLRRIGCGTERSAAPVEAARTSSSEQEVIARSSELRVRCASSAILFVGHLLHPIDRLTIEPFGNGNVRHRGGGRGAVPVSLIGLEPDHIAWTDLLGRASFTLHPSVTRRHNQ